MDTQNSSTRSSNSDRSPATAAVDGIFRRLLKISNPGNPDEVAKGLLARYGDEALRIKREQQGLPFSVAQAQAAAAPPPAGGRRPEVNTASTALDTALNALTTDPDLSDIEPELRGWSQTIRQAASDGLGCAGYAIDPGERDRAFGARRILGDYSRLSRYAGALTACAPDQYCRVARACDDVANIILVMIGDSLGDAGITRSGAVLQVPGSLLQARRDGVIDALRNLAQTGTADGEESWPRGPVALNQLYDGLDGAGAPDLRALLDETYLARQLDTLVDMATGSTSDNLRALGSAAGTTVQRLQRFLLVASGIIQPPSPPATMFFAQLQLFMQGLSGGNVGYRLPYLSRSPLLVSAFAASVGIDTPTQSLLTIALSRTAVADAVDCLCCLCDEKDAEDTILAGKVLFDIDRAIDLYALGTDTNGQGGQEWRAAVLGAAISASAGLFTNPALKGSAIDPKLRGVQDLIPLIVSRLQWPGLLGTAAQPATPPITARQFAGVINTQIDDELRWSSLVSSIAPLCRQDLLFRGIAPIFGNPPGDPIATMLNAAITDIHAQFLNIDVRFAGLTPNSIVRGRDITFGDITPTFVMPPTVATSLERIANDEDTIVSNLPKP
jgi:hypothetical protein